MKSLQAHLKRRITHSARQAQIMMQHFRGNDALQFSAQQQQQQPRRRRRWRRSRWRWRRRMATRKVEKLQLLINVACSERKWATLTWKCNLCAMKMKIVKLLCCMQHTTHTRTTHRAKWKRKQKREPKMQPINSVEIRFRPEAPFEVVPHVTNPIKTSSSSSFFFLRHAANRANDFHQQFVVPRFFATCRVVFFSSSRGQNDK